MIVVDLLRDALMRTGVHPNLTTKDVTKGFLRLWTPGSEDAAEALLDAAVSVVDEYLTPGVENSLHKEPALQNSFGSDVNRFLKWEQTQESCGLDPMHPSGMSKVVPKVPPPKTINYAAVRSAYQ